MVLDLVIIGLVIALLPLTIVAFMLILGARQGIGKGLAFIAGWMACLVAVIAVVVLVTGGKPPEPHTAPSTAALVVKAAAACSDPGRDWRESSSWMEQRPDKPISLRRRNVPRSRLRRAILPTTLTWQDRLENVRLGIQRPFSSSMHVMNGRRAGPG